MNNKSKKSNLERNFIKIKKTKKNFKGVSKKLTGKDLNRLRSMYIPPAYKTIYLSNNPNNKVQMVAEDDKGRNQYFYNPDYTSRGDSRKYKDLRGLVSIAEKIEKDNNNHITRIYNNIKGVRNNVNVNNNVKGDNKNHGKISDNDYIHIVIWLLINKHFRIGNIKYDKLYNSSGITTLKPSHFTFCSGNSSNRNNNNGNGNNGHMCKVSFIGKKGVENNAVINDNKFNNIIKHMKMKYGKHNNVDYLFAKDNGTLVKSEDITGYFNDKFGVKVTPKMFRTYYANYHMLDYLQNHANLKDNSDYKNMSDTRKKSYMKKAIGDYVSEKLHNTPAICRSKYINNKLLDKVIINPHYYSELSNGNKKETVHEQLRRFIG